MNKHLVDDQAKLQLKRLRKVKSNGLELKKNKLTGLYQKKPYVWIAFDNRVGSLWVGTWLHKGECLDWLNRKNYKVS